MKILQITNSMSVGGAEKLIYDTSLVFKDKGLNVDVFLLRKNKSFLNDSIKKVSNVTISKYNSLFNPFIVFELVNKLKHYDIIHVHLFPAFYWVALASKFLKHKPVLIYTEHNTHNKRRNNFIFKVIEKYIYGCYTKTIAITEEVKESLEKHLDKSNFNGIEVVNNGVNIDEIKKAKGDDIFKDISSDVRIITQVSSFREQKDQQTLIRAISRIKDNNILLCFVGGGHLQKECEKLVHSLKLEKSVRFLGVRGDVPQVLKASDIVVLSSNWEGFGLAAIEGMAAHKPVVVSNVPGLANIVKGYGLIFEVSDDKRLSEHLLKLLDSKKFYNSVADKCFLRADEFSINIMVDKLILQYKLSMKPIYNDNVNKKQ
jgi:glycosyltransferase involved in cell wall biosynthesis